jgi:hypothetical protein
MVWLSLIPSFFLCADEGTCCNQHDSDYNVWFPAGLRFELRTWHLLGRYSTTWTTPSALFCVEYFWDRVFQNICPSWPQTVFLLISASLVAKITGVSYQHLAALVIFELGTPWHGLPFSYLCFPISWDDMCDTMLSSWLRWVSRLFPGLASNSYPPDPSDLCLLNN